MVCDNEALKSWIGLRGWIQPDIDKSLGESCSFLSATTLILRLSILNKGTMTPISPQKAGMPVLSLRWFYGTSWTRQYT